MKDEFLAKYFETRARFMHDLNKLEKEYLSKYYWMKEHVEIYLPKNKDAKILVLGSGMGHEVWALNKMGYTNVIGVDIDEKQINIARTMGVSCIRADALEYLENTQDTYDAIIAFNLLEHFDHATALRLCKLCYSRLRRGGVLILLTPNASNPLATHNIYGDLTHKIGAFTETSITQLLKLAGFDIVITRNVKTFGTLDYNIRKRILKIIASIILYITWGLIKLLYILNGTVPPMSVSNDLLTIAVKKGMPKEGLNK